MDEAISAGFRRLLARGHGVLLVTGPTGSGKTTTLYGALASLDRERRNLITLEDPVEYRLPGLTQVQVHKRAGLGFASALRAVLRQDPDVIMVGELRDRETVDTALAAALTGHLVLSTLHTNDAPAATTRLAEMGAAPYLVAGGLIGVLAQRLARRLCERCRRSVAVPAERLRAFGLPAGTGKLAGPGGCSACDGTGYRGRVGIFELLTVDARIRPLILKRAPAHAIREAARRNGLRTLGQDAWDKVRAGVTTLDEVAPLLAQVADEVPLCPGCGGDVRAGFRICPACGRALRRRCACGGPLEDGWRRCPSCGEAAPARGDVGPARDEVATATGG
jgi:type IV pilus assembly protein PilB